MSTTVTPTPPILHARAVAGLMMGIGLFLAAPAAGQIFGEDDGLAVGLLARFEDEHGNEARRVDTQLAFDWNDRTPDPRLGAGKFTATWQGELFVRTSGDYRMDAHLQGALDVAIDGESVLRGRAAEEDWVRGTPLRLDAGLHEITIEYAKTEDRARLQVLWSGPGFGREPVDPILLYHDTDDSPAADDGDARRAAPSIAHEPFAHGRRLVRALRCTACHEIPTAPPTLPAPALDRLAGQIDAQWLADWLTASPGERAGFRNAGANEAGADSEPADAAARPRRMPHFDLDRREAEAIAAYLTDGGRSAQGSQAAADAGTADAVDAERGERLFVSLGCLACHRLDDLGTDGLFGGGDLSRIAEKRPESFFAAWLKDPQAINADHQMPRFDLADDEVADLAKFLSQRGEREPAAGGDEPKPADRRALLERGQALVERHRCAACHRMGEGDEGEAPRRDAIALSDGSRWDTGCTDRPHPAPRQPAYRLPRTDREAIRTYVAAAGRVRVPERGVELAEDLIERSNCLACHPRGMGKGIAETALPVAERYADAIEHVATLVPPSLNSIGDKLHDEALRRSVRGEAPAMRGWLHTQMPAFPLSDEEVEQLADYFIASDRIVADADESPRPLDEASLRSVGARLVTSDGFGCMSCHAVGGVTPQGSPPNARGPDLTQLERRVRRRWFTRWVKGPLRIVPRVEMPALNVPVPGVLDDDLDRQIDAVWQVLNLPDFEPPEPDAVRVVRRHALEDDTERSAVLTDVLRLGEAQFIKPMLVGLPNRHNVLIDLDASRLEAWWPGDVARQRTEGKSWYWEAAGENIWRDLAPATDFALVHTGGDAVEELHPMRVGQFRTEPDRWRHDRSGGITLEHRLHFALPGDASPTTVRVEQQLAPAENAGKERSGWRRTVRIRDLPAGWQVRFFPLASDAPFIAEPDGNRVRLRVEGEGGLRVDVQGDSPVIVEEGGSVMLPLAADGPGETAFAVEYTTSLPVDRFPRLETPVERRRTEPLDVVPGFDAVQLALPVEVMPTAFDWQDERTVYVTDLKGPVWRITDTDADGLLDGAIQFSDELATPFGVKASDSYVDVVNKYGLLRLTDDDGDGRADRTELAASGWGHTADYHDWAVGLPTSDDGGYFVALSCQQDERSPEAARRRGEVVRLVPREPTRANPQRFEVEPVSGGHRFPIGIAKNAAGDVFVTDNQGNYNPFNELNHVVRGARYGFINAIERRPGFSPPLVPPAIDIPHPWTRSVNGICFLTSPRDGAASSFGPFEGHLVGCEYDTRRLIRMTLQQVGDTYQGAAYPLSYDEPPSGPALLGPLSCAVSPKGDLYVGNLRESGWGTGRNEGSIVRLRMRADELPTGIAEIRARPTGFEIEFTGPVSKEKAADPESYAISSFTRDSTPQYGGEDRDRRNEPIAGVEYSEERNTAVVTLEELREDYVYEFHLKDLADDEQPFFPAEAYYTLRRAPRE